MFNQVSAHSACCMGGNQNMSVTIIVTPISQMKKLKLREVS